MILQMVLYSLMVTKLMRSEVRIVQEIRQPKRNWLGPCENSNIFFMNGFGGADILHPWPLNE